MTENAPVEMITIPQEELTMEQHHEAMTFAMGLVYIARKTLDPEKLISTSFFLGHIYHMSSCTTTKPNPQGITEKWKNDIKMINKDRSKCRDYLTEGVKSLKQIEIIYDDNNDNNITCLHCGAELIILEDQCRKITQWLNTIENLVMMTSDNPATLSMTTNEEIHLAVTIIKDILRMDIISQTDDIQIKIIEYMKDQMYDPYKQESIKKIVLRAHKNKKDEIDFNNLNYRHDIMVERHRIMKSAAKRFETRLKTSQKTCHELKSKRENDLETIEERNKKIQELKTTIQERTEEIDALKERNQRAITQSQKVTKEAKIQLNSMYDLLNRNNLPIVASPPSTTKVENHQNEMATIKCPICLQSDDNMCWLRAHPCGHVICVACGPAFTNCVWCNTNISEYNSVFFA